MFETKSTTVPITKEMVREAYRKVRSNKGSGGVDGKSLEDYQKDLYSNLYKLWNRLSSGSYFPKPVREVLIPKANGSKRTLGIPTVEDRIAQEVIKTYLEPRLESLFHKNSYGYRPHKSAHEAVGKVRENVRDYAWVIDMDIKSFFDEVSHELLLKALDKHVDEKWIRMYILRWLNCPSQSSDGTISNKLGVGTPQGGVISPLLANLYLHYTLDKWLEKHHPQTEFVRYADDVIVHCNYENEAKQLLEAIRKRLEDCKLRLNVEKTKIVYCQNYRRVKRKDYPKKFDFLGFTFKPVPFVIEKGKIILGFSCAISQQALTRIVTKWKKLKFHTRSTIQEVALRLNPKMIGIIRYYSPFDKWGIRKLIRRLHFRIVKWALSKYKSLKNSQSKAYNWMRRIYENFPTMFYHWTLFNNYI